MGREAFHLNMLWGLRLDWIAGSSVFRNHSQLVKLSFQAIFLSSKLKACCSLVIICILDSGVFMAESFFSLEYHGVTLALFRPYEAIESFSHARETTTQAKIGLETLIRLYFLRHSFESCNVFLCNFLVHVGNIAIESLGDIMPAKSVPTTTNALRSTLILCAQVT